MKFFPASYSPDGKTPGCLDCPRGSKPKENGATSVDQCTGTDKYLHFRIKFTSRCFKNVKLPPMEVDTQH